MSRPFTVIDADQRTPAWFDARLGRATGSKAACVMMGATTAGRADYLLQLALERMTGQPPEQGFVSAEMQRGIEKEPFARMKAEEVSGVLIRETGFLRHDGRMIGASLDGDSDDFSTIYEFKCCKSTTHVKYLNSPDSLVKDYQWQLCHNILVSDASGAVIGAFDDRMPVGLDYVQVALRASDLPVFEYERALTKFLREVDDMVEQLAALQKSRTK